MVSTGNSPCILEDHKSFSDRTIGGTGVSSILGLNPWQSRYEYWLKLTGKVGPTPENRAMTIGKLYEQPIANLYQSANRDYGIEVKYNFSGTNEPCRVRDREYEFITGSPDRILYKNGKPYAGLEIKTANVFARNEWGESGSDGNAIPQNYFVQCLHYMGLTGLNEWRLAVLFHDDGQPVEYRCYHIDFDEETYMAMRQCNIDFWKKYVETDTAPSIEGKCGQTIMQYYKEHYRSDTLPIAIANQEESLAMARLIDAQTKLKIAEEEFESEKVRFMGYIGDRAGLSDSINGKVTWKKMKDRNVTDWKSLAIALGATDEQIQAFTSVSEGQRRFMVYANK